MVSPTIIAEGAEGGVAVSEQRTPSFYVSEKEFRDAENLGTHNCGAAVSCAMESPEPEPAEPLRALWSILHHVDNKGELEVCLPSILQGRQRCCAITHESDSGVALSRVVNFIACALGGGTWQHPI